MLCSMNTVLNTVHEKAAMFEVKNYDLPSSRFSNCDWCIVIQTIY